MSDSSSLTHQEWKIIEPLLPQKKKTRPPTWSKREILDAILYQLKNGCNWGDLPQDFPPPSTVEAFNVKGIVRCGVQPLKVNPLQRVGYI